MKTSIIAVITTVASATVAFAQQPAQSAPIPKIIITLNQNSEMVSALTAGLKQAGYNVTAKQGYKLTDADLSAYDAFITQPPNRQNPNNQPNPTFTSLLAKKGKLLVIPSRLAPAVIREKHEDFCPGTMHLESLMEEVHTDPGFGGCYLVTYAFWMPKDQLDGAGKVRLKAQPTTETPENFVSTRLLPEVTRALKTIPRENPKS